MVGRTDWRGILSIGINDLPTIQYDPPGESKTAGIANARRLAIEPVAPPEYKVIDASVPVLSYNSPNAESLAKVKESNKPMSDNRVVETATEVASGENPDPPSPPKKPKGFIKINLPLYLYFVKNGDTLLARLPIVNGIKPIEQADLPDDRRRLETEAFLKGLQGEAAWAWSMRRCR